MTVRSRSKLPVIRGVVVSVVVTLAAGLAAASSAGAAPGPAARGAVQGVPAGLPHIPAKLACGDLVQPAGPTGRPGVPDFGAIPEAPTRVTSARIVPATDQAPEYCDVLGYVAGQVQFQLKLPTTTWQGRYLQSGCGVYCGAIPATSFPACRVQLGGDFALAATDDGHRGGSILDALWGAGGGQLRVDFGHRAVHVLAVAAKAIIAAYYGVPPRHSYFNGCSEGGREGLMEAQRYPHDFDGIIAGAPASYYPFLPAEHAAWVAHANTDAAGDQILTPAKLPALHAAVVAACDRRDGLADGQIDDPRACDIDPASIQCPAGVDRPDCLTPAQVTAVRRIYQAPHDERGRLLYPGGLEPGSEAAWIGAVTAPPGAQPFLPVVADNWLRYLAFPAGQPGIPLGRWRFTKRLFDRLRPEAGIYHALDPDLRAFRDAGGKLILYHGWSDQLIPPRGTLNYYQAVQDRMGGLHATQRFARLFMLPDMFHCAGGGPSPNPSELILQLVDWVERGTAPARVLAAQTGPGGNVIRTRPVFPYPLRARYTGSGSIDDAANFVAAPPPSPPDDHIDWLGSDLLRPRARRADP